jgi:hypothetical protein
MKKVFLIFMIAIFVLSTNIFAGQKFCEGEFKKGKAHLADWKARVSWSGGENDVSNCWIHCYAKVWNPGLICKSTSMTVKAYKVEWKWYSDITQGYYKTKEMFNYIMYCGHNDMSRGNAKLAKSAYTGSNGQNRKAGSSKKKYGKVSIRVSTYAGYHKDASCTKSFSYTK